MLIGEMCLLVAAVLVMTGLAKKITARLYINDFIATFLIFAIVLLNVRGGIKVGNFRIFLGGILSVVVAAYCFFRRTETFSEALIGILGAIADAGISFIYTFVFFTSDGIKTELIAIMLSVISGVWAALVSKRTFASCLFVSTVGSFFGITIYQIIVQKGGNIGGNYAFAVMWMSALFAFALQHLLALVMRETASPKASTFFEAGEMKEKEEMPDPIKTENQNITKKDRS